MLTFAGMTGIAGAEESDDIVFISAEPTIPVARGQVSSFARGAAKFIRKGHFDAFNALHNNRWKANLNKKDGRVAILYGSLSQKYAGKPEHIAYGFLKSAHAVFGLKDNLEDLKMLRVGKTLNRYHVKLQQTVDGVPVRGAFVLVHANKDGQVSMVQNDYKEELQVDNQRVVSREEAVRIALDDLASNLEREGLISDAKTKEMVVPYENSHIFIWKVTAPTEDPFGLWVYHIDAESSAILYMANEIVSLKKGAGKVYKSNVAWHKGKIKGSSLKNMFTTAEGYSEGWLWGLHGDIYDNNDNNPFEPDLRFKYDPDVAAEKPWFDATTAYYQMNILWAWWDKKIFKKFGPASPDYFYTLSIPVVVNVDSLCNAFYSPDLVDETPGFVFGNESSCSPLAEDLVLDKSVFSHEYAHAMMDWSGFDTQFGGDLHQYGRSMGEGNADWFAFLFTKNPLVGDVAWDWSSDGYLRNLDNTRVYPDDVDHPALGTPEEHYTGQIWGGYLYDLSRVLKSKALKFVYQGFFYFTAEGGHRPSHPDFYDAIYAQILAEQDLNDGKYKNAAKAWGCMVSRGLNAARSPYHHSSDYFGTGSGGWDEVAYFAWSFPQVEKIKTKGRIFKSSDSHEYPIRVTEAGKKLKVVAQAKKWDMYPRVKIYSTDAEYEASGTSTRDKATLEIYDIPPGEYEIVLLARDGDYSIEIQVK